MKKIVTGIVCFFVMVFAMGRPAEAAQKDTIAEGISVGSIAVGGMTEEEAVRELNAYVDMLRSKEVTLRLSGENSLIITPAELGYRWTNPEVVAEAAAIGKKGNVIQRYKEEKDLLYEPKRFPMTFALEEALVRDMIREKCAVYNIEAENATMVRQDDSFIIQEGQTGLVVDEEASLAAIREFFTAGEWNGSPAEIELTVTVEEPLGTREDLLRVRDILGSFTTSFRTSGSARSANVRNGCALINGTVLYPGEEFSTYEAVSPFTQSNGYYMAGSYLNGKVVDSLGGGICQVSTTLYNAVLRAELEVTERNNHSMIVTYVDPSADAAISESAGKDFRFVNNTDAPIYIEGYTTEDKQIGFNIYGEESRPPSHSVKYISEVIERKVPEDEEIFADAGAPVGSISVQSAHIGYKANLWKVVYENDQEVSREMINSSVYMPAPRSATVGVATADPNAYNQIMDAIATNSIDTVKAVAASLAAAAAPPEAAPAEIPVE